MELYFYTVLIILCILVVARWAIDTWQIPRPILWLIPAAILFGVDRMHSDTHVILRMVVICTTLLALMKGIVYAEWRRQTGDQIGGSLSWPRWMMFSALWFGMDPAAWQGKRRKLNWKHDFYTGLTCMLVGWVVCILLVKLEVYYLVAVFIPMSLAFHFGALRLLTAFWRRCGFPVRPLFRNPLVSNGLADFWSARWNISFSQMMARSVRRPLVGRLGQKGSIFAVFIASGILHELAITVPVQEGYGRPFVYFLLHGVIVLIEKDSWPIWLKKLITLTMVVVPLPLLFPEKFTHEIILPCLSFAGGWLFN